MPQTRTITRQQFIDILCNLPGKAIVKFTTRTQQKLKAAWKNTGNQPVIKESSILGVLNFHYTGEVNEQLQFEGAATDFTALPPTWGRQIERTPICVHTPQSTQVETMYMYAKIEETESPVYYLEDNTPISADEIRGYMYSHGSSRQGTENEIVVRKWKLENITSFTYRGVQHLIQPSPVTVPEAPVAIQVAAEQHV